MSSLTRMCSITQVSEDFPLHHEAAKPQQEIQDTQVRIHKDFLSNDDRSSLERVLFVVTTKGSSLCAAENTQGF